MSSGKKSALGRGLGALLVDAATDITTKGDPSVHSAVVGSISQINIHQIEANPFQPRTHFEDDALKELSESIKQQGIIQPLTVRKLGYDKYQIISGERRFRAAQMAGLEMVPAYIRIANDQSMLEMALVENIQRQDLNAIEVGISYNRLIEECDLTHEQLAEKVGKDRSTIANYLRLLKLPPQIQKAIQENKLSMGHARALINITDPLAQLRLFEEIIQNNLSVRKVEELARQTHQKINKTKSNAKTESADIRSIQNKLTNHFETKVSIKTEKNGGGKITFSYFSTDDLNRLLDLFE
ncbi:MAG TPA: ParB/RepB/Spo0J family partition protein [Bacteroidia bacterium]|nr:ParB/RepB/Spo0J family partition protein [Bacteroidia bacterium]HNT80601.1 ParB/RepB/Spo0J family partition protein [Bacteroidia bacterium]